MPDLITIYEDEAGEWRWNKRAGNGEKVSDSGESYITFTNAMRAAEREAGEDDEIVVAPPDDAA